MREAGVLEDYLKEMKHDPARRYHVKHNYVVYERMASHLDVSTRSPFASSCWSKLSAREPPGA